MLDVNIIEFKTKNEYLKLSVVLLCDGQWYYVMSVSSILRYAKLHSHVLFMDCDKPKFQLTLASY